MNLRAQSSISVIFETFLVEFFYRFFSRARIRVFHACARWIKVEALCAHWFMEQLFQTVP